jgi:hypothetical protein
MKAGSECSTTRIAGKSIQDATSDLDVGKFQYGNQIKRVMQAGEHDIQRLGLRNSAGKPVQQKRRSMFPHPCRHEAHSQQVRDEQSETGEGISLPAKRCPVRALRSEKRTRGDMRNVKGQGESVCLGALAGGRRSQQDNPLLHLNQRWLVR